MKPLPEFTLGVRTSEILGMVEFLIKHGFLIGIPTDRKSYKSNFTPEELINALVTTHQTSGKASNRYDSGLVSEICQSEGCKGP